MWRAVNGMPPNSSSDGAGASTASDAEGAGTPVTEDLQARSTGPSDARLPVCRAVTLQSGLVRVVLAPERFRGGCPFGVPASTTTSEALPHGIYGRFRVYRLARWRGRPT